MTLRERGEALISIAHLEFRGELREALVGIRHFPVGVGRVTRRGEPRP